MKDAIAFSGNPLDRAGLKRRDHTWVEAQLAHEDTRYLPFWRLQPLVKLGTERSLAWARSQLLEELDPAPDRILLGVEDGVAHFVVDVTEVAPAADPQAPSGAAEVRLGVAEAARFEDLRAIAPQLQIGETGVAAQARSLLDWHQSNRWCPACGGGTRMRQGGGLRVCGDCLVEHYPRTNPVAIGVVSDGDRCLLGRAKGWPAGMYSALAGFIEPGETIEEGLRREVAEEAGIEVGAVRYVKSQPWPFPASLMIGCIGEAVSADIEIDPGELEEAAWFERSVVRDSLAGRSTQLFVPPALALAHHLIRTWADEG